MSLLAAGSAKRLHAKSEAMQLLEQTYIFYTLFILLLCQLLCSSDCDDGTPVFVFARAAGMGYQRHFLYVALCGQSCPKAKLVAAQAVGAQTPLVTPALMY